MRFLIVVGTIVLCVSGGRGLKDCRTPQGWKGVCADMDECQSKYAYWPYYAHYDDPTCVEKEPRRLKICCPNNDYSDTFNNELSNFEDMLQIQNDVKKNKETEKYRLKLSHLIEMNKNAISAPIRPDPIINIETLSKRPTKFGTISSPRTVVPVNSTDTTINTRKKGITSKINEPYKNTPSGDKSKEIGRSNAKCGKLLNITILPDPSDGCCGISSLPDFRIWGGTSAQPGQFPWMVYLKYFNTVQFKCAGFLISNRFALTAAHCVDLTEDGQHYVSHVILGQEQRKFNSILKKECLNGYRSTICIEVTADKDDLRDCALLKLAVPATYTDYIRPLCLPDANIESLGAPEKLQLKIVGWGETEKHPNDRALMHLDVSYIPTKQCKDTIDKIEDGFKLRVIEEYDEICAGAGKGRSACNKDSGGPLMFFNGQYHVAIGVVIRGPGRSCGSGLPTVFFNVHANIEWIKEKIKMM